ncbi:MAG TPA: hypothetical protein VG797_03750 [Phycisphaerales bacterium]|nr:hypothetical protein [Phycisphaerales bacterium]
MSQFGMQMPGSQRTRSSGPNVYSALMLVAVVCLLGAVIVVFRAGMMVGPGGDFMGAFQIHPSGQVKLGK